MGNAGQANYCASKAGLMGLTRSNARELARRNMTVNAVAPGFIATDMTEALPEKTRQELAAQIPLERLGRAEDIANAVVFLAAEEPADILPARFSASTVGCTCKVRNPGPIRDRLINHKGGEANGFDC